MAKKPKGTTRKRVDLINFIIDATQNQTMAQNFLNCQTAEDIQKFFIAHGYNDIPYNDCKDILAASLSFTDRGVDQQRRASDFSGKIPRGY